MGQFSDILSGVAQKGVFNAAIVIPVGNKSISLPVPIPDNSVPNGLISQASFPKGNPGINDVFALVDSELPSTLPAPLNVLNSLSLKAIDVRFTKKFIPSGFQIAIQYSGKPIGFSSANISDIVLTYGMVVPLDKELRAGTFSFDGEVTLMGIGNQIHIDSDGFISCLVNDGKQIDPGKFLNEVSKSGLSIDLSQYFKPPKLQNVFVTYDLKSQSLSFSSDLQATIKFFCCSLSIDRFIVQIGKSKSGFLAARGNIGSVQLSGFIQTPGDIQLEADIPSFHPAEIVSTTFPKLAKYAKVLDGITVPKTKVHLAKAGNIESLSLSSELELGDLVPTDVEKFLNHLSFTIPQVAIPLEFYLSPNPLLVRLRMAMLAEKPLQLIPKSSFKMNKLWFQTVIQANNPGFGLATVVEFEFDKQKFEVTGAFTISANEADLSARMTQPAIWKDTLGIKGLEASNLNLDVGMSYEGIPTIGFGGKFEAHIKSINENFVGDLEIYFNGGNPAESLFSAEFNKIDLAEGYALMCPTVRDKSLTNILKQISFDDVKLYFAPIAITVAGQTYPKGYVFRGDAKMFGFGAYLDVEVLPAKGISFDMKLDKAIKIASILKLYNPKNKAKGPEVSLTTFPKKGKPIMSIEGGLQIANSLKTETSVEFDTKQFHLNFTTKFFKIDAVKFTASSNFANFSGAAFKVTFSLTNLSQLNKKLNSSLKTAANDASSAIGKAEKKVRDAEKKLKPAKDLYEARKRVLKNLIHKRDKTKNIFTKAKLEAQIVVVQGEVTTLQGGYESALGVLKAANGSLSAVNTVQNVALNAIAAFINTVPVKVDAVSCSEKLSALGSSKFTASVVVVINNRKKTLSASIDFNAVNMIETLAKALYDDIVDLFKK